MELNQPAKHTPVSFIVQYPKGAVKFGIALSVLSGALFAWSIIFRNETSLLAVFLFFFSYFILCLVMTLELARKKVIVTEDFLMIQYWTGKIRIISRDEITKIRMPYSDFYLRVYKGEKIIFRLSGFEDYALLFHSVFSNELEDRQIQRSFNRLRDEKEEKEEPQQEIFTMRKPRFLAGIYAMVIIIAGMVNAILIVNFSLEDGLAGISFMAAVTMGCLYLFADVLRWRVRVSATTIRIRSIFGREKEYLIDDITKVQLRKGIAEAYVGEKRIVKFSPHLEYGNTLFNILQFTANGWGRWE